MKLLKRKLYIGIRYPAWNPIWDQDQIWFCVRNQICNQIFNQVQVQVLNAIQDNLNEVT